MPTLESATLRRLLVLGVTAGILVAEKKLGLELDASTKAEVTALVVAYLIASNVKEAALKKAEAAAATASAEVATPQAALDAMKGPQP